MSALVAWRVMASAGLGLSLAWARAEARQGAVPGGGPGSGVGSAALTQAQLPDDDDVIVEEFLARLGLDDVLAHQLRRRIEGSLPEQRREPAEALAQLYVRMLGNEVDAGVRQRIEGQARELLERVPEADTFELRIDLAKAQYLRAEEAAERVRLALTSVEEEQQAREIFRQILPDLTGLRERLQRVVSQLEAKERSPGSEDPRLIRLELGEHRRLRSLAAFYEGWTRAYLAFLDEDRAMANSALPVFGVLLNAVAGRAPAVERFTQENLRFEHVARAGVGVALCQAIAGNDVDALRWLEVLDRSESLPQGVKAQLFARRMIVLAQAGRWSEALSLVSRSRFDAQTRAQPLEAGQARLVAVLALRALRSTPSSPREQRAAEEACGLALADLVARGELAQIVDLVKRFGTVPLGDSGFIVAYVRGLQAYERAREMHLADLGMQPAGTQIADGRDQGAAMAELPASRDATVNAYREAAQLFDAALRATDIQAFEREASRARLRSGLARYYAGDLLDAAGLFERAYETGGDEGARADALWYAIVSLDGLVERGRADKAPQRDRLAVLFVRSFPTSPRATRLLLRQTGTQGIGDAQALEVLLAVPPDSPLRRSARNQAGTMLYRMARGANAEQRGVSALRFAQVAEELLAQDLEDAKQTSGPDGLAHAQQAILRIRQLLDVLLGTPTPDLARVEGTFAALDQVRRYHSVDLGPLQDELDFRRLQVAILQGGAAKALPLWDALHARKGAFASAADHLLFRHVLDAWRLDENNATTARDVVRFGLAVLGRQAEGTGDGLVRASNLAAVRDHVARAAAGVWASEGDTAMRDLAIRIDTEQVASGNRTVASLRRLGALREQASDLEGALSAWSDLMSSLEAASLGWYEARYHTLRLLQAIDPRRARDVYRQFTLLYPRVGPEPWGPKIQELGLGDAPTSQQPSPQPSGGTGGGR